MLTKHSWQVSLGFLVICADFAQFLRSFSIMRNFAQIFSITKIFAQEINFRQRQNFSVWSPQGSQARTCRALISEEDFEVISTWYDGMINTFKFGSFWRYSKFSKSRAHTRLQIIAVFDEISGAETPKIISADAQISYQVRFISQLCKNASKTMKIRTLGTNRSEKSLKRKILGALKLFL